MIKSIKDQDFQLEDSDYTFPYQADLTPKLDILNVPFDQGTINEIVLWKLNRYSEPGKETLNLLNQINPESREMDETLTKEVLSRLLATKGIQLSMASTILKFKNKYIYQIIDQRVYRIIYQEKPKTSANLSRQIDLYLKYLVDLRQESAVLNIPFEQADRILYMADKRVNNNSKIRV